MKDDIAIQVNSVSKNFLLPHQRAGTLKSMFVNPLNRPNIEKQKALDKVSFDIKIGEFFGIVGRNGSGKSTLLKCMAGVYTPDNGSIKINGKLVPFIELGVGFNPELSGRDNVYLNGALLGFSRQEMEAMYEEIVGFAELENFMDQKLKNYSSGMQVRLAFSIAIKAEGDILLLDEVLAVGDAIFQQKCFDYFNKLKKEQRTVILVSHSIEVLRQYCTSGVLLEQGKVIFEGAIDKVADQYLDKVSKYESNKLETESKTKNKENPRRGNGKVTIESTTLYNNEMKKTYNFTDNDQDIWIQVNYTGSVAVESPVYGITIKDAAGRTLMTSNSLRHHIKTKDLNKKGEVEVKWKIPNIFNNGKYTISPAVADSMGQEMYEWVDDMAEFNIRKKIRTSALVNPTHVMEVKNTRTGEY